MENTPFEFFLKANAKIGQGIALNLAEYVGELGFRRPGVVIDKNVANIPYIKKVLGQIKKRVGKVQLWEYDIPGEPDYDSLDRAKILFLDEKGSSLVDCFIGIGGGSVIDFAKGLATLMVNQGEARTYRGFPKNLTPPLPTIALPTVAGAGTEVTYNASFIDWKEKRKMGINTLYNFPKLTILDPLLTINCPLSITVSSAMDAMVHALESYATPRANPLSKIFSLEAFRSIYQALPRVVINLADIKGRLELQLGAYLAGIAIVQAGGGPASILSYPLGVHGKVPHGLAGAVFLPYVVEHNVKNGFDYSNLYDRIEPRNSAIKKEEKSMLFSKIIFDMTENFGVYEIIKQYAIKKVQGNIEREIKTFKNAFNATSPVSFSPNDASVIFRKILNS